MAECSICHGANWLNSSCLEDGTARLVPCSACNVDGAKRIDTGPFMQSEADSIDAAEEVAEGDEWTIGPDSILGRGPRPIPECIVVPKSRALAAERRIEELERRNA